MNEKLELLLTGLGAITELWAVTYRNFLTLGFSEELATKHTQLLIGTIIASSMTQNQNETE